MDPSFSSTNRDYADKLIAKEGEQSAIAQPITLLSGESVVRGEVLGEVTADGKFRASLAAETDGSEVPRAIAAEDIDASAADAEGHAYVEGAFNQDQITLGAGHTVDAIKQDLWDFNIYLVDPVTATPT